MLFPELKNSKSPQEILAFVSIQEEKQEEDCHWIYTSYGWRKEGQTRFVFVAPHAAGDDQYTGVIARKLADMTGGSCVINKKFIRPTNSRAGINPNRISDFNRNSWSHKYQKYIWRKEDQEKKKFYTDIASVCDSVQMKTGSRAVVIHVHGMNHDHLMIDLGTGLKTEQKTGKLRKNTLGSKYTGKVTMPVPYTRLLKEKIEKSFQKETEFDGMYEVGIGCIYPAYSKKMGIQFHKHAGRDEYAVQVEINKEIKKKKKQRDVFVSVFSSILLEVFN